MYKALVIGCGNIGAWYDLYNNQILTHAKAYFIDSRFSLSIFDLNKTTADLISTKYHCDKIDEVNADILKSFDCVSICTPTHTHFLYLNMAIEAEVKVIICEKPLSYSIDELNDTKSKYYNNHSKILVNYIRRFQPSYIELKEFISELLKRERLTNINIRYQRGFINNCSHAFDTIEYLMNSEMELSDIKKHNLIFDHFNNDPTISLQATWKNVNVCVHGLSNVSFSHFEFDLYFEYSKICIKNSGQNIEIYKAEKGETFLQSLNIQNRYTQDLCLKNYMVNVVNQACKLLEKEEKIDNFIQSLGLNQRMLNYMIN